MRSAVVALETARRLESLPATEEALRSGKLSLAQVSEIASTAGDRPEKEAELVAAAVSESLPALQERCRAVRAEGMAAVEGYEKVRKSRYLRHWTDAEGAFRLEARLCPDDGARVLAALEPHQRRVFARARREGRRESYEAYAADALVALAGGEEAGPRGAVAVRVDHSAWVRGHTEEGEVVRHPRHRAHPRGHRPGPGQRRGAQGGGDQGRRRGGGGPCRAHDPRPRAHRPGGP